MDYEERVAGLIGDVKARELQAAAVLENLEIFMGIFYDEIAALVSRLNPEEEQSKKIIRGTLAGKWRYILFGLGNAWFACVAMDFVAKKDEGESLVPFDAPIGRIILFRLSDKEATISWPLTDIFIAHNGEWCAAGLGGPIHHESIEVETIRTYVLHWFERIIYNCATRHLPRTEVKMSCGMSAINKPPIGFITPEKKPQI